MYGSEAAYVVQLLARIRIDRDMYGAHYLLLVHGDAKTAPVAGTNNLKFTDPVPADSRQ